MALVVFDRVQQTGTANTTVSFTLTGSVTGFQSFTVVGNGNTTFYAATDASGNWEVGIGTYATGGTLTRTTILSSSNSGSAVTFSGTVNVFVTYPSEKSVNLDASGNVTALGTITSGVWNGTTIPVAYGGTGVTASSGANSVVLRDSNQNITANNFLAGYTSTATTGGTTTLTVASTQYQRFTGTSTQTVKLPDATTLQKGFIFIVDNDSTGSLTVVDNASSSLDTIISGSIDNWVLLDNSTTAGTWIAYSLLPASYDFNNTSASFGNASIINATWNGTAVTSAYGGTGLTSFGAANYALYSTSSSLLTAGTLPTAAGGTNSTSTPTAGGAVYGTGSAYAITAAGTTGQVLTSNGASAPTWQVVTPTGSTYTRTSFTATAGQTTFTVTYTVGYIEVFLNGVLLNGTDYTATSGTSVVLSAAAALNDIVETIAYNTTSVGTASTATNLAGGIASQIPYQTGAGATGFIANGTSGQVLTSAGTSTPTWATPIALSGTNTWTGTQLFTGSSSVLATVLTNAAETTTVSATAATGTIAYYPSTQSVLYYTTNASANWTTNLTFSSGTTLNTAMTTGQSLTVAFLVTQGSTAYYNTVVQVDGTTSGVTTKWQGGAPTSGNASGIDVYTYTIIKTASATFTVLASLTQFK